MDDIQTEYAPATAEFHNGKVRILFEGRTIFDGNARESMVVKEILEHLLAKLRPDMAAALIEVPNGDDAEKVAKQLQSVDPCTNVL